jgi:broad-specificity NMP kinase
VKVVEFLGPPGSGKSTLAAGLRQALPGAASLPEAVHAAIGARGEDGVARIAARLTRASGSRLWEAAYARSTDRFSSLARFSSAHPETMAAVLEIQRQRADRDLHPEVTLGWVLNLMARYQLAVEDSRYRWLVVDEGFAQRGVALHAGGFDEQTDLALVDSYVAGLPSTEAVVAVETPIEVCQERLDRGGWSERLVGLGAADRRDFLEAATMLSVHVATALEEGGRRVIWVSGTTPPADSITRIAATFTS